MAKLRMAHASTHGARKPPGPILKSSSVLKCCHGSPHQLPCPPHNVIIMSVAVLMFSSINQQTQKLSFLLKPMLKLNVLLIMLLLANINILLALFKEFPN